MPDDNEEEITVIAESADVNLAKSHPIRIAEDMDRLVGSVRNIYNTRKGLDLRLGLYAKRNKQICIKRRGWMYISVSLLY